MLNTAASAKALMQHESAFAAARSRESHALVWHPERLPHLRRRIKTRDANAATATFAGRSILWARMKGLGTEALNIGWGDSAVTASANSDVNLFKPQTESRVAGTSTMVSTSQLADTYQVTGSITCLVGGKTITEAGLFDTVTNSPITTIATSSQAAAATTITLAATTGFPSTLNHYIQVENEVQLVTSGQASVTKTVTRAQFGSASAAHAVGTTVALGGDGGAFANATLGSQSATVNAAAGGNCFAHADFAGVALNINDSIAFTWKDQLT